MKKLAWLSICVFYCMASFTYADTLTYQAISDFPQINASEVPYYKETAGGRNVLAIDASVTEYRNKFARAETTFKGVAGTYDITIAALGELDGECIYRLLVNGVVKGSATNARVETDYDVQNHQFKNIEVPAGAILAVESMAVSNGLIPENDEFAFARGRWRSLILDSDTDASQQTVDLSLNIDASKTELLVDNKVEFTFSVVNTGKVIATSPQIKATLSDALEFVASAYCQVDGKQLSCNLQELAVGVSVEVSITAKATEAGEIKFVAEVSSDQTDSDLKNNKATKSIVVKTPETPESSEPTNGQANGAETSSGGGGTASFYLLLVLFGGLVTARQNLK